MTESSMGRWMDTREDDLGPFDRKNPRPSLLERWISGPSDGMKDGAWMAATDTAGKTDLDH